jgi:hypothetical protein
MEGMRMRRTPRWFCALGVVALAAAVTGPLGAHAADGDNDVVVFAGHIQTAVPIPAIGGPTGGIAFGFRQTACETASTDSVGSLNEVGGCLVLQLNGIDNSIVCGTGAGNGFAQVQEPDGNVPLLNFAFAMVAGIGVVQGDATGVFVVTPVAPNPPSDCGQDFLIEGAVATF